MNEYIINEARIPLKETEYDFVYDKPRDFQADFLDWLHGSDSSPVSILKAPTGAGKTATFHTLIEESDGVVLLVYPTNALIKNQKEELNNQLDVTVEHITGDTLSTHGINRSKELKSYITDITTDVIITNPDVLQAIIQGSYVDPYGSLVEIYEYCSAVVYDEFHFYDDFSASGILLQTYVAVKRSQQTNRDTGGIVFSSATPTKYYKILEKLDIEYTLIESAYADDGSKYRYETKVKTHPDYTYNNKHNIVENIKKYIQNNNIDKLEIAVICNSVKSSNEIYNQITNDDTLSNITVKDNGFDTNAKTDIEFENKNILITTSKAEVGINYDIKQLYMDKPRTAESFIQRFGRAGRKSEATVHIYGIGATTWNEKLSFNEYITNIYETLPMKQTNEDNILKLIGLRSAYAIQTRNNPKKQLKQNLKTIPYYTYWNTFIQKADELTNNSGYVPKKHRFTKAVVENILLNLKTLRGNTRTVDVVYNKGNKESKTKYGILSVINQYNIKEIKDDCLYIDNYKPKEHGIVLKNNSNKYKYSSYENLIFIKNDVLSNVENTDYLDSEKLSLLVKMMKPKQVIPIDKLIINTDFTVEYLELN